MRRTNLSAQVVAEVREHFSERVYKTMIPRTVRLSEAPSFGKCILEHDATASGAKAYRALADRIPASPPWRPVDASLREARAMLGREDLAFFAMQIFGRFPTCG